MSSYKSNIERLRQGEARHSQQEQNYRTESARISGQAGIEHVRDINNKLSAFSGTIKEWRREDIEKKKQEGIAEARQAEVDKAKNLSENAKRLKALEDANNTGLLLAEFEDAKAQDTAYQELKASMLKSGGESVFPDADRIAQLSPWQQVGYAQEKLRVFNETFPDKLAHSLANSEKPITLGGITFTPQELRDNNLALPMKEAAIQVLSEDIKKAAQIDRFSPEMLRLSKTNDSIQKAKDAQFAEHRQRYNIESSANTRGKALLEWNRSEKTGEDLHRLILINGNTVDKNNKVLGNTGSLDTVFGILTKEGIENHNPEIADHYANLPLPVSLARKLGAKPGTTYGQQWPGRFASMKKAIKEGYVKAVNDEEKFINAAGTELTNEFKTKAREGALTSQEVNDYKRKYGELGLPIPGDVTNYETLSDRDQREDEDSIEALMASQNGYISHEQLDAFHPKAALEHREKATKLEEGALKKHDADKKIKAHLDTAFTNMGIKGNEKSPAYVEAMANAKADYANKYNQYIAMGYSSAQASHLALHAQQVTDKETGEVLPDSMGVLHEIKTNGENSKYVITGQSLEKELKPGHLRVARIRGAKQEILEDPNSVTTKVIGGDYGHRQITTIAENVEKHGRRGLYMDKGALQYYKGIARGRNARQGGWWGIVDAQLKAAGHKGLNPAERPKALELLTGEDADGNTIPDPRGSRAVDQRVSRAMNYPSQQTSLYAMNSLRDGQRFGRGTSVFDQPENLPAWYTLGGVT